ncbi:type I phosphomannose isomerase catalytic subunit [Thermococcus sp. MV5]|uniref:type I phosphomannose isomerase catalytic subunit n=1 Tax=Thermococcus sp. MV5 TaxID=1638272 RepID=UPI001F117126|nr:type I phosphomannose isomerase catalytic subunit [Thermococcus sp. MV5]
MFEFIKHSGDVVKKVWGTETWIFSAHPYNPSIVKVKDEECDFISLLEEHKEEILGSLRYSYFPLLIKIIDPRETLSVQVHPSEEDTRRLGEKDHGKDEAWIVLSDEGFVYLGFRGSISYEELSGDVIKKMYKVNVKRLDSINIPAGTLHALGKETKVLEVSANSNITYRVHDFGRGRELHLDKALQVIRKRDLSELLTGSIKEKPLNADLFKIEYHQINNSKEFSTDSFRILVCTHGKAKVAGKQEEIQMKEGESVLVPASTEKFKIRGRDAEIFLISAK